MKCTQIKEITARYFDEDRLMELSGKQMSHIDNCPNCKTYLKSLQKLDRDIQNLLNYSLLNEEKNELHASIKTIVNQGIKLNKKRISNYIQRMAAIAAILLIALVYFILNPLHEADQDDRLVQEERFQLYSAKIEKKPTSTIIYESNKPNEPLIIWLYVTKGDK